MGGDTSNNQEGTPEGFGGWGQVDPFGNGDAQQFVHAGGTQQQFMALTPAQQQQWRTMKNGQERIRFVQGLPGYVEQVDGHARPQGTSSDFTTAATPNVSTPFGGMNWTQDPVTGRWTQNSTLSPGLDAANTSLQGIYADLLGQGPVTGDAARQQAIDASYGQATSRLDPQWDKREEAMRTRLLNQGLDPTSEASKGAMSDFGMQRNDAYGSAMNNAILQGQAAGDSIFRNGLASQNAPLQQMALIKALSQTGADPSLLNSLIAQKNYENGVATNLQQQQAANMQAGVGLVNAASNFFG